MKTCTKCKETRDVSNFRELKFAAAKARGETRAPGQRSSHCLKCVAKQCLDRSRRPEARAKQRINTDKWKQTAKGRASTLVGVARRQARDKGLKFDLTNEWVLEKLGGRCEATGLKFVFKTTDDYYRHPRSASVDRIDGHGDYTMDNVRIVVWQFNLARNEYGDEVLKELVEALSRTWSTSSRAAKAEGSTTIRKRSRAKRPEVHTTLQLG
jgi:hypothetical protein